MFCGKCGSNIPDGYEFCMKCGTKIDLESLEVDTIQIPVMSNQVPSNKNRLKILIPVVVLVVIAISIGSYFVFFTSTKIEGRYNGYSSYDDGYFDFTTDKTSSNKGTYVYLLSNILDYPENGVWEIKDGKLIISDYYHDNDILLMYKNYIYYADYTYKCKIPDGKTFDLICTLGESKYSFSKNGAFTSTYEGDVTTGTYERDGDTISVKLKQPTTRKDFRLLIVEDGINNSAYYKK